MPTTPHSQPAFRFSSWGWSIAYLVLIVSLTVLAASGVDGWSRVLLVILSMLGVVAALVRKKYPYALLALAWIMTAFTTQVLLIPALFNLGVRRELPGHSF